MRMESRNSIKKQYGLQVPKKTTGGHVQSKPSVFGEDSESENEDGLDWVKKAFSRDAAKSVQKKQIKLEMQKALEEDPTVYQYDEIYEQLEEKKQERSKKVEEERKPRYIQTLIKQAERRKREQERRMERQVQKERETEDEVFKNKESFITASYRKKLEEFKKLDEEERRQDELEALADVSKQEDLSGFYRHLYHQTVTEDKPATGQKKKSIEENIEMEVERKDEVGIIKQRISLDKGPLNSNNEIEEGTSSPRKESELGTSKTKKCKRKSLSAPNSANQDADSEITSGSESHSDSGEKEKDKLAIKDKLRKSVHSKRIKKNQRLSAEESQSESENKRSKSVLENGTISSTRKCDKRALNSTNQDADSEKTSSSESHSDEEEGEMDGLTRKKKQRENMHSRQYRKRQRSSGGSQSETENERPNCLLEKEIDKDSDLGTSGTSGEKASRLNNSSNTDEMESKNSIVHKTESLNDAEKGNKTIVNGELKEEKRKKKKHPKRSVYEKRTVGAKLEEARQRYFARKAERERRNIVF